MTQIKNNALRITTESADRSWTGVAAAWASLNGTGTIALRDSLNISSAIDNGPGDYSFTMSNAISTGNYSYNGNSRQANGNTTFDIADNANRTRSTTQYHICANQSATRGDIDFTDSQVFGDLA